MPQPYDAVCYSVQPCDVHHSQWCHMLQPYSIMCFSHAMPHATAMRHCARVSHQRHQLRSLHACTGTETPCLQARRTSGPETQFPSLRARNPNPEPQVQKPEPRASGSETRAPSLRARNPNPEPQGQKPETRASGPETRTPSRRFRRPSRHI